MATDAQIRSVQAWSLQEATAADALAARAQAATQPLWAAFTGWYAAAKTAAIAKQTQAVAEPARETAAGLGAAYMVEVLAALGVTGTADTRLELPPARQGADLAKVYARPATEFRKVFALTGDRNASLVAALGRLEHILSDDVMIGRRDGEQEIMRRAAVTRYGRIIHPELAKHGASCGLCIAASDRLYKSKVLRPVHGGCNCTSAPRTASFDPREVNKADLAALYDAAGGSNKAADLKRTRFQINEHGELGPVLTVAGQHFQGPGDPDKADPIARAKRRLPEAERVLELLESTGDEEMPGALRYQHNFVTHLRDTAALAA